MTTVEFKPQFARLANHFRMGADMDRDQVYKDWFRGLAHYHVDAVSTGIDQLTRESTETYWPALGKLLEIIRNRLAGMQKVRNNCGTCHGSTWIDAAPYKVGGIIYEGVVRCPDCGVPAPQMPDRKIESLSSVQYHEWKAGRYGRDLMPDGMKAKPKPAGDPYELREAMERIRQRLFPDAQERSA